MIYRFGGFTLICMILSVVPLSLRANAVRTDEPVAVATAHADRLVGTPDHAHESVSPVKLGKPGETPAPVVNLIEMVEALRVEQKGALVRKRQVEVIRMRNQEERMRLAFSWVTRILAGSVIGYVVWHNRAWLISLFRTKILREQKRDPIFDALPRS